jgi:hypothetical protein
MRSDHTQYVHRIAWLVATTQARPMARKTLASRWGVTPRAVSQLLVAAERMFGVEMEHVTGEGYRLRSPGILNVDAIRKGAHR